MSIIYKFFRFSLYWILFDWNRIRIVFTWNWIRSGIVFAWIRIRIKVWSGPGTVTNFLTSWIRIRNTVWYCSCLTPGRRYGPLWSAGLLLIPTTPLSLTKQIWHAFTVADQSLRNQIENYFVAIWPKSETRIRVRIWRISSFFYNFVFYTFVFYTVHSFFIHSFF